MATGDRGVVCNGFWRRLSLFGGSAVLVCHPCEPSGAESVVKLVASLTRASSLEILLGRLEVLRSNLAKREHLTTEHASNNSQSAFLCAWRFLLSVHHCAVFHDDNPIALLMSVAGSPEHRIVCGRTGDENRVATHSPQRVIEIIVGETA